MDERNEALSLILHGCKSAGELEQNLMYLVENQPDFLLFKCDEIAFFFNKAMNLLSSHNQSPPSYAPMVFGEPSSSEPRPELGGYSQPMDPLQLFEGGRMLESEMGAGAPETLELPLGVQEGACTTVRELGAELFRRQGSSRESVQAMDGSDSARSSPVGGPSTPRLRARRDAKEKYTKRVAAPPSTGNPETPPDDGFTWRKYGQKMIQNSRYPRSYYRCTHKSYYGCDAKKQVQRLDDDPYTFEVTYHGGHTCQTSSTSLLLPQNAAQVLLETPHPSTSSASTPTRWLSSSDQNAPDHSHVQTYRNNQAGGESSRGAVESSHVQGVNEMECLVENFADFMFDTGSSINGIDSIFHSKQEK